MNPRLIAHSGPWKGQTISLTEQEVVIGRESSAALCLADLSVSRYHCRIRSEDGRLQIVDLDGQMRDPHNPTLLRIMSIMLPGRAGRRWLLSGERSPDLGPDAARHRDMQNQIEQPVEDCRQHGPKGGDAP